MEQKQKAAIEALINLYPLASEVKTAAVGFIPSAASLLRTYLGRYDLPAPLNPVCAQLAIAMQTEGKLLSELLNTSASGQSGSTETEKQPGIKSISQGDTSISFESGGEERKNLFSTADSAGISVSAAQVMAQNKVLLSRFKRGAVQP